MNVNKLYKRGNAESGQAIVLIAMLMIILIASLGLALDGGDFYWLHRDAQNAADAAAFAATGSFCRGASVESASNIGLDVASANGFDETNPNAVKKHTTLNVDVVVNQQTLNNFEDGPATITVTIVAQKPSYFIQVVWDTPITVTVEAIGFCTPERARPGLVALSESCQYAMNITGSQITILGGVASNGGMNINSSNASINGDGYYMGDNNSSNVLWNPSSNPQEIDVPMNDREAHDIEDYAPSGEMATAAGSYYHYSTGDLRMNTNPAHIVLEGLYFTEGNIDLIGDNYTIGPAGATFVARGSIGMSATNIELRPFSGELLLFSNQTTNCGVNAISLSSSNAQWEGLIYAPHGGVKFADSENSTSNGGIVAQTIDIHASNTQIVRLPETFPAWFGLAE